MDQHGNSKKKEKSPCGGPDENVFDIMQGVSISFFVKDSSGDRKFNFYDLYGSRQKKYEYLSSNSLRSVDWNEITPSEPYYFFGNRYQQEVKDYNDGFSVTDIFLVKNNGLKTDRDSLFIDFSERVLEVRITKLLSADLPEEFKSKYKVKDSGSYKITTAIKGKVFSSNKISNLLYRPFDIRSIYYDPELISRPAFKVMEHMLSGDNVCLILPRQIPVSEACGAFVSTCLSGHKSFSAYNINTIFPLYLYSDALDERAALERNHNFNHNIVREIDKLLGFSMAEEGCDKTAHYSPLDLFDYIYAFLHCPIYQEKYRAQLEIDFPKIPYPYNQENFWQYAEKGKQLRLLHTLVHEDGDVSTLASFPEAGDNRITRKIAKKDLELYDDRFVRVWINETQYFDQIPKTSWDMYIGGFQPAQKWLKDRVEEKLDYEDILTYRKIIEALDKTRLIKSDLAQIGATKNT